MKLWLRDMFTWVNPVNWLGETRKTEQLRRIAALEAHITDLDTRYGKLENRLNYQITNGLLRNHIYSPEPEEN